MNTKRGFTPIIILLIVTLALVGMVGYYLGLKGGNKKIPQTTNWKEYSSDNCGTSNPKTKFSISIPNNWNFSTEEDKFWAKHTFMGIANEKFALSCGTGFGGGCPSELQKEIRLGNETKFACYWEDEKGVHVSQIGAISDNGIGVDIEADFPNNEASKEELYQILSAFKFLDSTYETENWKTFRNEKYRFQIKYPPDWEIGDGLEKPNNALQIRKTGPTNGNLDWTDGSILIISPTGSVSIDLAKELGIPEDVFASSVTRIFNFDGWMGYGWENNLNDPLNYNEAIIATKSSEDGQILKINWSQTNSNNGLTAEKYLFPMLSTFKFTN